MEPPPYFPHTQHQKSVSLTFCAEFFESFDAQDPNIHVSRQLKHATCTLPLNSDSKFLACEVTIKISA